VGIPQFGSSMVEVKRTHLTSADLIDGTVEDCLLLLLPSVL